MPPKLQDEAGDWAGPRARRNAWVALAVLTAMNLLNYLDRFVVPAVQESIKHSPIAPSDQQLGFVSSAFLLVYMCAAPLFGILGARHSRMRIIAAGVAIWSVATALGGLVTTYASLVVARALVGVGEAAYGTIAPAVLADAFPERWRARVFAIFYMAIPVGSALGYVLGGAVDHAYGWRAAFFVAGAPGLLFALAAFFMTDPPRGEGPPVPRGLGAYGTLLDNRPYMRTVLGYAAYTFALGGIAVWMPTFLARIRHVPLVTANTRLGGVLVVTGFLGTFLGGWVADHIAKRTARANLWVSGVATLAAVPFAWIALVTPDQSVFWATIAIAEVLLFASTGPVNAAIVSGVSSAMRAPAMALSILTIHLLGDVPSPWIIGTWSDQGSLATAVLIIPVAVLVSGIIWTYAAWKPTSSSPADQASGTEIPA